MDAKKIIYDILTDATLSVDEKHRKVQQIFQNYLEEPEVKKIIFEKIEWFFHDGLGTYFELLVAKKLEDFYQLWWDYHDIPKAIEKMKNAITMYDKFFSKNEYKINYWKELSNIENGVNDAFLIIQEDLEEERPVKITHSSWDFAQWNARDVYITLSSWIEKNYSLKVDKSWKVAVFDGQTPKIFEKVYSRFFNLSLEKYNELKWRLFWTEDESIFFSDYENVAYLTQVVIIEQFWLKNAQVNNLLEATIQNEDTLRYFIKNLKESKGSKDKSKVIKVNRLTGKVWLETILDTIDEVTMKREDFSFTKCEPRKWKIWTEPTIKYLWKAFVSFQIKHYRGKNPSRKFSDITTRLREIKTWK